MRIVRRMMVRWVRMRGGNGDMVERRVGDASEMQGKEEMGEREGREGTNLAMTDMTIMMTIRWVLLVPVCDDERPVGSFGARSKYLHAHM